MLLKRGLPWSPSTDLLSQLIGQNWITCSFPSQSLARRRRPPWLAGTELRSATLMHKVPQQVLCWSLPPQCRQSVLSSGSICLEHGQVPSTAGKSSSFDPTPFLATKLLSFLPSELGRLMTCRTQTMLLRCAEGLYIQPLSQNGQKLSKVEPGAKEAFKQRLCDHLLVSVERLLLLGVSLDWFCLLSTYDTLDTGLNTEDVAVSKTEILLGSFSLEVSRGDGPWVNNYTDKYIVTGIVRWSLKPLRIRLMIFYVKSLAQCLVHGR